jgi:hypothetical protein
MSNSQNFPKIKFYARFSIGDISATSDQNLMIYDSLDSSTQAAYNRSVFTPPGQMVQKIFIDVQNQ